MKNYKIQETKEGLIIKLDNGLTIDVSKSKVVIEGRNPFHYVPNSSGESEYDYRIDLYLPDAED
jgi:hypothetical protein